MITILYASDPQDRLRIAELQSKLSLRPLLMEGLDEEDGESKFQVVRRILRDVRQRQDEALLAYTAQFDRVTLTPQTLRVPPEALQEALAKAEPRFLKALDLAIANIRSYQQAMLPPEPPVLRPAQAHGEALLGVRYTPLSRVGLYIPGGAAAYPSSVLMTAIPAQVAGVEEICLCSPMRDGQISPGVLVAAARVGLTELYAVGGAQAIAAMAFGTPTIRAVDKIVGPGNSYVQLAKKELFGLVDIDSFAGPSEVIVLADRTAHPGAVAAELLAQAEHAPGSCLLITASLELAQQVQAELERQLQQLSREKITRTALAFASAILVVESPAAAIELVNDFAPEHLQITTASALEDAKKIRHAGAIFIGPFTPVAAGDYLAGPSHVLPTSGTGRFFSGLSAESFRKRTSLVQYDRATLEAVGPQIVDFALHEGFDGHARSVTARLQDHP